jgi:molybdenum cofactor cytidylyltransferase
MMRSAARPLHGIACVLLAAGGSRRLGRPKQLVRHRGRPLLLHAVEAARAAAPAVPVVVVLGAHAGRLRAILRRGAPYAVAAANPRWREGLARSLATGLRAAPPGTRALLVHVVDQPNVDGRALGRLLGAWRRRPGVPAAAFYAGRPGVPAVLPKRYWRDLLRLGGDQGARSLLRQLAMLTLVPMPEAETDIDTPADLKTLRGAR